MDNTLEQRTNKAKATLNRQGLTISAWALKNGFSRNLVIDVIRGRIKGRINKGHKIAVLLGIKEGEIVD